MRLYLSILGGGTRNSDLCYVAAKDSARCAQMIGIYQQNYKEKEEIYKKTTSFFNHTKWLFMLDAPFSVSDRCCTYLKKNPANDFAEKSSVKTMTAQMASESVLRTTQWFLHGCNFYDGNHPISNPMAFWTEQDVLAYIYLHNLEIAPPYGKIIKVGGGDKPYEQLELFDIDVPTFETEKVRRTGCFACGYGIQIEKESRLKQMIDIGEERLVDWILRGGAFEEESGLWKPKGGLGMFFCYEWMNRAGGLNIWLPDKEKYYSQLPDEAKRILDNQGLWQWNPNLWEDFQRRQNIVKGGDSNGSRSI